MSWDVVLIKTHSNSEPMQGINEKNTIMFDTTNVVATLKELFDEISQVDDQWLHFEGGTYAMSFNLASKECIMLHISILDETENGVDTIIHDLCKAFECRAFDTTTGDFFKLA